jgi:hypothetical protein
MGPFTLKAWATATPEVRAELASAMHVSVSRELRSDLYNIARSLPDQTPFEFAMPAPRVTVEFNDGAYLLRDRGAAVDLVLLQPSGWKEAYGIRFFKRFNKVQICGALQFFADRSREVLTMVSRGAFCDLLFSLMAEPRLTQAEAPTRQQRRHSERLTGVSMTGVWHRISWTIGAGSRSQNDLSDDGHRMPLHFCRAHWVHVGRPTDRSVLRCGSKGHGHYTWRGHSWRGHPDFGVKLGVYEPGLAPEGVSEPVVSALRKNATEAATAAAIRAWQHIT